MAALRAERDSLQEQIVALGDKQRELEAARADAVARAAALRGEVKQLVSEGADVVLVAEKRSQADALAAVAQDYDAGPCSAKAAAAERQLDALSYPLEQALSEVESFEALIEDPFGEEARRQFEASRARVLEERARAAREQATDERVRRHEALEQLQPTWSRAVMGTERQP